MSWNETMIFFIHNDEIGILWLIFVAKKCETCNEKNSRFLIQEREKGGNEDKKLTPLKGTSRTCTTFTYQILTSQLNLKGSYTRKNSKYKNTRLKNHTFVEVSECHGSEKSKRSKSISTTFNESTYQIWKFELSSSTWRGNRRETGLFQGVKREERSYLPS